MSSPEASLGPKQKRAVEAILAARSLTEAAERANVGFSTLNRWRAQPAFREALREAQRRASEEALSALAGGARLAVQALVEVVDDPTSPAGARVAAARTLLDSLRAHLELSDLAERVEALECLAAREVEAVVSQ